MIARGFVAFLVGATALAVASVPAWAHEFELALVPPAPTQGGADARDGFLLAVRQSPDVGHPDGVDAGDHLGDVDVEVVVVDDASPATRPARLAAARREGLPIVVVVGSPSSIAVAAQALRGGTTLLVAASDAPVDVTGTTAVVLTPAERGAKDGAALDPFTREFAAAYGRPPSTVAASAYDAGRFVDAIVRDLGADLGPPDRLADGARRASTAVLSSAVDVEIASPASGRRAEPGGVAVGRWAVAGVLATIVVGVAVMVASRRRRVRGAATYDAQS